MIKKFKIQFLFIGTKGQFLRTLNKEESIRGCKIVTFRGETSRQIFLPSFFNLCSGSFGWTKIFPGFILDK